MENASLALPSGSTVVDGGGDGGGGGEDDVILRSISPILLGVMASLSIFGMVLAAAFLIFNIRYRHSRLVKMSSPNLNILIAVGAVCIYACVVLFGIDVGVTSSRGILEILCRVRVSLLTVGFTLVYGSMFSKAWRVYKIFTHAAAKRMVIRDSRLMTMVGCLLLLDVVVLALWLVLDAPSIEQKLLFKQDPSFLPLEGILICKSQHIEIWITVLFVVKAGILLLGTYLSWETRNITVPSMNDAKCIVVSVYTCVILVALVTALMAILESWPNLWYCCVSVVMMICPTEMLLLQYIPKIRAWRNNPEASYSMSRSLTSSYLATAQQRSLPEVEEELFLLSKENASLKRALSEKENTIKVLHEHVGSAKEKLRLLAVDPDMRQDSGCDFDMSSSSTSHEDRDNVPGVRPPDLVKEEPREGDINGNDRVMQQEQDPHKLSLKYSNVAALERQNLKRRRGREGGGSIRSQGSMSSIKSVKQFEDLRDSIVQELHQASDLSHNLREAIAQDLHSCRTTPMYMVIADTERELAGVLKDSYNLDGEDISISSSTFTYDNPVFSRNHNQRSSIGSVCACHSRQSSFRSVASLAMEFSERDSRNAPPMSRSLQWGQYIPPKAAEQEKSSPPRVVRSSDANALPQQMTKSIYHTYV